MTPIAAMTVSPRWVPEYRKGYPASAIVREDLSAQVWMKLNGDWRCGFTVDGMYFSAEESFPDAASAMRYADARVRRSRSSRLNP